MTENDEFRWTGRNWAYLSRSEFDKIQVQNNFYIKPILNSILITLKFVKWLYKDNPFFPWYHIRFMNWWRQINRAVLTLYGLTLLKSWNEALKNHRSVMSGTILVTKSALGSFYTTYSAKIFSKLVRMNWSQKSFYFPNQCNRWFITRRFWG